MHVAGSRSNAWKYLAVLFLTFILSVPVQIYAGGSEEQGQEEPVAQDPTDPHAEADVSDNILTEEEVLEMGVSLPPDATRNAPWNQWERFGYPGSGEMPALAYNSSSGKIYTYGGGSINSGFGGTSYSSTNDQFYYNVNTHRWVHFERAVSPNDRFQASVAVDEGRGKMYVYGGNQDGAVLNDLWEFDMGTEAWKRLDSSMLPSGRAQAPMVLDPTAGDKGVLYLHMGVDTSLDNITGFYKIDLANLGAAPVALNDGVLSSGLLKRTDHDMCIDVNNKLIYLFGGRHKVNDNSYDYYTEFWVYNIIADEWTKLVNPPEFGTKLFYGAKMFYRSADNTVNIWGGRDATTGTSMNRTLWTYDTQTTLWSWKDYNSGNSPAVRAFYGRYYSAASDTYFIFQGRYYTTGGGGAQAARRSDVAFMDASAKTWTTVPGNISAGSVNAGIFAHNKAQDRIYYIGPSINWGSPYGNGSAYIYYFDLKLKDWKGPFYNPSGTNPERGQSGRSNWGICYVPTTNEVFLYGGGGVNQGGGGAPPTYYDFADMWKMSLTTYSWTKLYDPAGPGERQGFQMVYNSKDGMIYFYGGYNHPDTTSAIVIYEDFYKFNPISTMFTEITLAGTHPGARYGTSLLYEPDDNLLYLFGGYYLKAGQTNPQEKNDLFTYNFTTELWSEVDTTMNPSSRSYAKLVYDPLTRDIILTGGSLNNDLLRYRILEGKWYTDSSITVNPGNLNNHAVVFIEETRDLYLFGGGARSGVWKFGVPQRLGIQKMTFVDPDGAAGLAYAMYRPYHFRTTIKAVDDISEIAEVRCIFQQKDTVFSVVYNHTLNQWSEVDVLERAFITSHTASENGLFLTIDFSVKFNWTWAVKSASIDRSVIVRAKGTIAPDELIVRSFLTVKNQLELKGVLKAESSIQGPLQNRSWVSANETLNIHGIKVAYKGANVYPPLDSYKLVLWDDDDKQHSSDYQPGEEFNFTMVSPSTTKTDISYKINLTGIPPMTRTSNLYFNYSTDADPPGSPGSVLIFDNAGSERSTIYDNDPSVYLTWSASEDSASGVDHYYWSLDDNSGTRFGTPANLSSEAFEVNLSKKGSYNLFVWAEDKVGNIGASTGAKITIDMDPISFRVLNPDLKVIMPYKETNFIVNLTDVGGSGITTMTVKYRFTNHGITDTAQWLGSGAWKWVDNKYQSPNQEEFMEIEIPLKTLTNGYDNFIQLQAMDGAGTLFFSPIYTLMVDEDLRFPIAEIVGPANGTRYDDPEDVMLSWNVTFYQPEDVTYKIFMSLNKNDVMLKRTSALFTTVYDGMTLNPSGLDFGTYYWTVEPWALETYAGSCRNGVFWFTLTNEASYAFEVTAKDTTKTKLEQGGSTFFQFTLKNTGLKDLSIIPSVKMDGTENVTDLMSYGWIGLNKTNKYGVVVNSVSDINFEIKQVRESAPIGNYTMNFTFVNQYGIREWVLLELEIVAKQVKIDGDPDPVDLGPFIVAGIIAVLLVMIIIGGLYFFLVKKKTKNIHRDIESELDEMEGDIGIGGAGLNMAPQPKGLKTGPLSASSRSGSKQASKKEAAEDGMEWEAPKLAEEGSEDDWMNLVATETISEAAKSETVEEDMSVETDKQKSLKDLLFEMSDEDK
jgi:hypothetical protein